MAKIQSVEPNIADLANGWMKSYRLDYKLEQESLNTEIDQALNDYASKNGGTGGNRPDAKLLLQDKNLVNYPVLIEYKGYKDKLVKLDAEGNISEVYVGEDYLSSIAYYDGYLYAAHRRGIIKINPENGEAEKVLRPEDKYEFSDFCMVDNRMYIQSSPDADIKGVYSNTTDLKDYIVYCDIEGDSLSKPVLYLGDVKEYNHDRGYDGEILYMYVMNIYELHTYGYSRHQYYSDYGYEVSESVGDDGVENILSIEHRNIPDGCIEDVGAANVHNGAIYYVHLLEDGFEVCKCSIDGTNVEVLDTYKDGVDYRDVEMDTFKIAISDNKILVNSCDSYAKEGYVTGEWVNGVEFVTELR